MIQLTEGTLLERTSGNGNVGSDPQIEYPGVFTCITLTGVVKSGTLVGAHFARAMTNGKIEGNLQHMAEAAAQSQILNLYIVGMLAKAWCPPMVPTQFSWNTGEMVNRFRGMLNPGNVYALDTTGLADTVDIRAEVVAGTAGALIDVKPSGGGYQFIREHQFQSC